MQKIQTDGDSLPTQAVDRAHILDMGVEVLRGKPDDVIGLAGVRDAVNLPEKLVIERFGLFPPEP